MKEKHFRESEYTSHGRYEHDQRDRKRYAILSRGCSRFPDAAINPLS